MPEDLTAASHDLNQLAAYLDGRLTADERRTVTTHLTECADCRAVMALYSRGAERRRFAIARLSSWFSVPPGLAWASAAAALVLAVVVARNLPLTHVDSTAPIARPSHSGEGDVALPADRPIAVPVPNAAPAPARDRTGLANPHVQTRGAARTIGGKTFRLVAGEWIDTSYDPTRLLPVVDVSTDAEREQLRKRVPALARYTVLGPRATIVFDGAVYRFRIER